MDEMLVIGTVMAACLGATVLLWGDRPTRQRILLTTWLGIGAAVLAWMLIGNVMSVSDTAANALAVWLIAMTVVLVRVGLNRTTPDTA